MKDWEGGTIGRFHLGAVEGADFFQKFGLNCLDLNCSRRNGSDTRKQQKRHSHALVPAT